jgi:hypothetical protein
MDAYCAWSCLPAAKLKHIAINKQMNMFSLAMFEITLYGLYSDDIVMLILDLSVLY